MATRLPVRFLRAPFGPIGEGNEILPLRPRATTASGWLALALVALVIVVHSRFTYVKH
jgi:hypothetical protein